MAYKLNIIIFNFDGSRKPFDLKHLLIIYNVALASLNFYIAYELLVASNSLKYNYICQPCREIYSDDEMRVSFLQQQKK